MGIVGEERAQVSVTIQVSDDQVRRLEQLLSLERPMSVRKRTIESVVAIETPAEVANALVKPLDAHPAARQVDREKRIRRKRC